MCPLQAGGAQGSSASWELGRRSPSPPPQSGLRSSNREGRQPRSSAENPNTEGKFGSTVGRDLKGFKYLGSHVLFIF